MNRSCVAISMLEIIFASLRAEGAHSLNHGWTLMDTESGIATNA